MAELPGSNSLLGPPTKQEVFAFKSLAGKICRVLIMADRSENVRQENGFQGQEPGPLLAQPSSTPTHLAYYFPILFCMVPELRQVGRVH